MRRVLLLAAALNSLMAMAQNGTPGLIGQDSTSKVITTGVPFLSITPDARAAGMGDVGVATSADAASAFWNAGKLAFIENDKGISMSYTPWLAKIINDMYLFHIGGFYKINREQTIGVSMKYFDLGEVTFTSGNNTIIGEYNPREFAIDATYSRMLTENLSVGTTLRYVHSNLTGSLITNNQESRPGKSVAADLGVYYQKPFESRNATLTMGATITNLGAKISYSDGINKDFLPTNLRVGAAYKIEVNPLNSFAFAMDLNKLMVPSPGPEARTKSMLSGVFGSFGDARGGFKEEVHEVIVAFGAEYWYNKTFALRTGYFNEARDKGYRKYATGGVGFRHDRFGIDVAYMVPMNKRENALAETVRFTLHFLTDTRFREDESVTDPN
ncbi:MAG: type IX secretion system outer membrane channel protein PorV [Bacteroidota bacterium]